MKLEIEVHGKSKASVLRQLTLAIKDIKKGMTEEDCIGGDGDDMDNPTGYRFDFESDSEF